MDNAWIQTYKGGQFWPLDPRPQDVDIEDIAHALSMQCRFAGHVKHFYSVAQHSVLVARHVPQEYRVYALLHDAAEAYLFDCPKPIRHKIVAYSAEDNLPLHECEDAILYAIFDRYGIPYSGKDLARDAVQRADRIALATEKRDLLNPGPPWGFDLPDPWPETIIPLCPFEACQSFSQYWRIFDLD